jgi:hypothetical protein
MAAFSASQYPIVLAANSFNHLTVTAMTTTNTTAANSRNHSAQPLQKKEIAEKKFRRSP